MLSAIPGVVALVGAAVGYGVMKAKVETLQEEVKPLTNLSSKVERIDERTIATDRKLDSIDRKLDRLIDRSLGSHTP